ncbi:GNAT family N-acetyltransferase [Paenibacillus sp. CMAA1364]
MTTKLITDIEGLLGIKEDWERLEQCDQALTYYNTFQFNYYWWLTYGKCKHLSLFIICSYRDNQMVGIAPLMITRIDQTIMKYDKLCFLGKGDYFNFIINDSQFSAVAIMKDIFQCIEENSQRWDRIELTHVKMDTPLLRYLLRHDQYNPYVQYLTSCLRMRMNEFAGYEQFDKEILNTKLRRKRVRLLSETRYQFKVVTGQDCDDIYDRISYVHKMEKQYLHHEKGRSQRRSLFEDKNNELFLKQLFQDNDKLITFMLETEDQQIMIYMTCYLYNGVLYGWNMACSPEYARYHGVVDVLLTEIIHYLFEDGKKMADQIDFGAGSYSWKFRWSNQFSVNYSFSMWNRSRRSSKVYQFLMKTKGIVRSIRGIANEH